MVTNSCADIYPGLSSYTELGACTCVFIIKHYIYHIFMFYSYFLLMFVCISHGIKKVTVLKDYENRSQLLFWLFFFSFNLKTNNKQCLNASLFFFHTETICDSFSKTFFAR